MRRGRRHILPSTRSIAHPAAIAGALFLVATSAAVAAPKTPPSGFRGWCRHLLVSNPLAKLLGLNPAAPTAFPESWIHTLVRDRLPVGGLEDPSFRRYVQTMNDATFRNFAPWFDSSGTSVSFEEMLFEMHLTALFGPDDHAEALAVIRNRSLRDDQKLAALQKRFEPYTGRTIGAMDGLHSTLRPGFRDAEKSSAMLRFPSEVIEATKAMHGIDLHSLTTERRLPIPGVPEKFWPTNVKSDPGMPVSIMHFYPTPDGMAAYRSAAGAKLVAIRAEFDALDGDRLIDRIAEYYYVAGNAHFFPRVNNSMLMSQVNYLLLRKGMSGISHGYLDYVAACVPLETFKRVFAEAVRNAPRL
jgi:hypothetical protein